MEQYGFIGLIGIDVICVEAIVKGVGEVIGVMVGLIINVGMVLYYLVFFGSISLCFSILIQVVMDYVSSLVNVGFSCFYFINGYGGNIVIFKVVFFEIYYYLGSYG